MLQRMSAHRRGFAQTQGRRKAVASIITGQKLNGWAIEGTVEERNPSMRADGRGQPERSGLRTQRADARCLADSRQLPPMSAPLLADSRRRRGDDDEIEIAKDDDVLPAVAPGEAGRAAVELLNPPAVAVTPLGVER